MSEELVVRRAEVKLGGGRLLRVERWGEGLSFSLVWASTPAGGTERLRLPVSVLGELIEALRKLEEEA